MFGLFNKEKKESLDKGLEKTKQSFFSKLSKALVGKSTVDDDVLDQLEEILVGSDVGIETTLKIIERIQQRVARDKYVNTTELDTILKDEIAALLADKQNEAGEEFETPAGVSPYVIMVVGVNGVGKTTTIGKLAAQYKKHGKKVVLGAADTFRAAAVDQLKLWGERVGVPVIAKGMNTDPSAVAFEAVQAGVDQQADVVIIDTAGRLHTKVNLMSELSKIKRVMQKVIPNAPHDVMLVLDGSTGQNANVQAREFTKATEVTSLAITKLDGTAKGGVVIGISDEFRIPVRYIGVGEKTEDLQVFNKQEFVNSLFGNK
ncbi:MAG: signal recognition particle-docking protein FtsY [Cyclobacteriaceae bacterium]|jgi:fused signal recognition particle receptor|nr:signal recognition particle-docking protein FtsY [Flammeovirgaceae bacterium]MCZ8020936.1 signal recognition particle-docking protein FtsY [Cytophagales bacterium]MCZ8329018.1 signal recognition particle-docking protein FtsY [Cyclobacteriaceae bacterium]